MEYDVEGFLFPHIDYNKCINCGLCYKVCPIVSNTKKQKNKVLDVYAVMSKKNEIRNNSSSGGAFYHFAENILSKGGSVFATCFNNERLHAEISSFDSIKDIKNFQKSKYVQSDTLNTYNQVKTKLNNEDKPLLYVGTPCQIAGLKSFLGKEYTNLVTMDIICHGTPSPGVLKSYCDILEKKYTKIKNIDFRDKTRGWEASYLLNLDFIDSRKFVKKAIFNSYYMLFISNLILREACFNCQYCNLERQADITIGDFWGVKEHMEDMDDGKGTSTVIINSEKGKKIFDEIKLSLTFRNCSINQAIQRNLVEPTIKPKYRSKFFKDYIKNVNIFLFIKYYFISYFSILNDRIFNKDKWNKWKDKIK